MEADYIFWRDLLDTYQSLPDWLKLLWLVIPSATTVALGHMIKSGFGGKQKASKPSVAFPAQAYRSWYDDNGILYIEQIEEMPPEPQLPLPFDMRRES